MLKLHTVPSLGAIRIISGQYTSPRFANKNDEFECPDCKKKVILCKGQIIAPYFRHVIHDNPCNYYDKPNESQIHKDAKLLLKSLLENKIPISFVRTCRCCNENEEYEIPERDNNSKINIEYRFHYNGTKIADVAFIENNDIVCLFEICNTHKTKEEDRPEPWFEINAMILIKNANLYENNILKIQCIRSKLCDFCIENKCKGQGQCISSNDNGRWITNPQCEYKCFLVKCPYCKKNDNKKPLWAFEDGKCMDCENKVFTNCKGDGSCFNNENIKDIYVTCNYDCKLITCNRCNNFSPKFIHNTNVYKNVCKSCDIEIFQNIYLNVPYSSKDDVKKYGAKFDGNCKKWYISNCNLRKDEILLKYKHIENPY